MKKFGKNVDIVGKKLRRLPKNGSEYLFSDTEIDGDFNCAMNEIDSLEGSPAVVKGDFVCYSNKLNTLEGAPSEVHGDFICGMNSKQFTVADVRAVCKVRGKIYPGTFIKFKDGDIDNIIDSALSTLADGETGIELMNIVEVDEKLPDSIGDIPVDYANMAATDLWNQFDEYVRAFKPDRAKLGI